MNELISLIRSFGIARLGAVIGVTFGVAVAMALIIARIGAPPMTVLYADIGFGEAKTIIDRLEQDGVRHELRDSGNQVTILVPREAVSGLRLELAADGLILSGGVGYEIFDNSDALGATSFQQNINRLRALEGELARTLSSISGVRSARVHLVMPERELFARDRQAASASIIIDSPGGLAPRTVRSIVNLAASAVPGLEPSNVTLLDSAGQLLASASDVNDADAFAASIEDKKIAAEARIRRAVEDIVGRIVGPENVRVEVTAEMDFSRVTERSEIIDPDSQTVLSSTTVEESSSDVDPNRARGVSVANALPGAQPFDQNGAPATSSSQRTEETTNYEITKTVRNAVREEGLVVKRLSVAVAINSVDAQADGANAGAPRTDEELAQLETLVRSTVGYNAARGDQVSIIDMPFSPAAEAAPIAAPAASPLLAREDMMRLAEVGALSLIAIALVFFVLRPMLSGASAPALPAPATYASDAGGARAALPAPGDSELDRRIDLAQVEGQVKASSISKVSEIVKAHTDESANILRGWMREAS